MGGGTPKRLRNIARGCPTSDQSRPPIRPPSTRGKISDLTAASPMPRCPNARLSAPHHRRRASKAQSARASRQPLATAHPSGFSVTELRTTFLNCENAIVAPFFSDDSANTCVDHTLGSFPGDSGRLRTLTRGGARLAVADGKHEEIDDNRGGCVLWRLFCQPRSVGTDIRTPRRAATQLPPTATNTSIRITTRTKVTSGAARGAQQG